jgi:hypothetical protein
MSTQTQAGCKVLPTVQVRDPNGHKSVYYECLPASTTVSDIRARAKNELSLTDDVDWNVREDSKGRLLQDDQLLADIAGSEPQITLTMQPDAGLG